MLAEGGGEPEELPLPPTTQALIAARLDRLDAHEREVLERASVVGREFWPGAVNALGSEAEAGLGATLLGLVRRELVEPAPSAIPGEDGFRFRHVLIRDAAYASAPKGRRADHHERLVDWLTASAGGSEELDEILGYHLEQAHHLRRELATADERTRVLAERAYALLARAGRRADARGDAPAARSLLGRALALEVETDDRLELRRRLAHALWNTGETARAIAEVDGVAAEAAEAGDRAEEWYARLDAAGMRGVDGPHGLLAFLETAARAVEVFSELEDERGLAQAWRRISLAESVRASYAAAEAAAERALHHARRCDERQDASRAADVLCTALLWGPTPVDEALARCEELLTEAGEANATLRANVLAAIGGYARSGASSPSPARAAPRPNGSTTISACGCPSPGSGRSARRSTCSPAIRQRRSGGSARASSCWQAMRANLSSWGCSPRRSPRRDATTKRLRRPPPPATPLRRRTSSPRCSGAARSPAPRPRGARRRRRSPSHARRSTSPR